MRGKQTGGSLILMMLIVMLAGVGPASADPPCVTDTKIFLVLNSYTGLYFFDDFWLMAEGEDAQIWVQTDLSWGIGDPRATPTIDCDQAAYMLAEFEANIYPGEVAYFGPPDMHDGSLSLLEAWGYVPSGYYGDPEGRHVILVDNIVDDNYYDPIHLPYVHGFYSDTFEAYFDRNIISIDAYDWENRTGPGATLPFFYESVFAREYQHLLHADYDPDEERFITEGLADLAQYLVGYGLPEDHIAAAASHPENSLVVWEDQGELEIDSDFGHAFLFQLFLMERYGIEFITAEFLNPDNGMSGVNSTLDTFLLEERFGDVYHDFRVALLIDDDRWKGGRYGFQALDFNIDIGTSGSPNPEAFSTPGAPPWGTDFIWIEGDCHGRCRFIFNGMDYTALSSAWTSDGDVLWSGEGNLADSWAIFQATGGGTLSFDTYWDIEEYWDFGFVQVSTDGGYTWTSLGNAHTTSDCDPSTHPDIVANMPGLTGLSTGWLNNDFDLSPYAGQDVLIAFRYMTDWATFLEGWYIDNVSVDGTLISDGSDESVFSDITELLPIDNNFIVTLVGIVEKNGKTRCSVHTVNLNEVTEEGLFALNAVLNRSDSAVMLVTFDAPEGFTGYADYTYDLDFGNGGP